MTDSQKTYQCNLEVLVVRQKNVEFVARWEVLQPTDRKGSKEGHKESPPKKKKLR